MFYYPEEINFNPLNSGANCFEPTIAVIGDWGFWSPDEEKIILKAKTLKKPLTIINFFVSNQPSAPIIGTEGVFKRLENYNASFLLNYYLPVDFVESKSNLRLFAPLINRFNFEKVYVLDSHPLIKVFLKIFKNDQIVIVKAKKKQPPVLVSEQDDLVHGRLKEYYDKIQANFNFYGVVIEGQHLGRKLGFPTVNLKTIKPLMIKEGVYFIKAQVIPEKRVYWGMGTYWSNPKNGLIFEAHFFDFTLDVYKQLLNIELISYHRDNMQFESLEDLREQLLDDEEQLKPLVPPRF